MGRWGDGESTLVRGYSYEKPPYGRLPRVERSGVRRSRSRRVPVHRRCSRRVGGDGFRVCSLIEEYLI